MPKENISDPSKEISYFPKNHAVFSSHQDDYSSRIGGDCRLRITSKSLTPAKIAGQLYQLGLHHRPTPADHEQNKGNACPSTFWNRRKVSGTLKLRHLVHNKRRVLDKFAQTTRLLPLGKVFHIAFEQLFRYWYQHHFFRWQHILWMHPSWSCASFELANFSMKDNCWSLTITLGSTLSACNDIRARNTKTLL